MGAVNTQGMKVQCPNPDCGYVWLTNSQQAKTSCPKCGWRVRLRASTRINQNPGNMTTQRPAPPRYY